ncbi:MAG TPA: hypothetical protein VGJ94_12685 [Syntrophorhabdaceae bacterium]|jgi:hypothetical protein
MAGKIKLMLDSIISQRSKGSSVVAMTTKTKIVLKGIDPDRYNSASPDDPAIIDKIREIARELSVSLQ